MGAPSSVASGGDEQSAGGDGHRLTPAMSSRKLQALAFIKRYFVDWGYSPTLGEIGAGLSVSRKRAHELVEALADDGMITVTPGKTRGIHLVDRTEELTEHDVLTRLLAEGWTIGDGSRIILPPGQGVTENGLFLLPLLDHLDAVEVVGKGTMERPSADALRKATEDLLRKEREKRMASLREWARRRLEGEPDPIIGDASLAWRRRHPNVAAAERRLRKGRAETLKSWKHKNEGTPETHEQASRRNQGALAQLYKNGSIDAEQLASAEEIAWIAERIGADVSVRTASLETRVDLGPRRYDSLHDERIQQVRREMAYTQWRSLLPAPAPVLEMLVGEPIGFTIVAARYRMHHRKAKRLLIHALDLWPEILGRVCKAVDERDLAAAHARLVA
jgi:hypothetical protein